MIYKNRKGRQSTKRGDRAARKTHYGNPIKEVPTMTTPQKALPATTKPAVKTGGHTYGAKVSSQPKFKPVSDEVTVYGAKKFRTPYREDEFTGTQGSPIPAYVFDIDGTLQGYGSGADTKVLEWAKKIYKDDPDAVFLIITARDHGSFGYETSFNWLMRHFPYPFIGPFARPKDDPRYASEFKRELAQGFEDMGLYQILGAADDNDFVIDMWKQWAIDHFEDPKDFNLLECSYGTYASWRSGLPSKGETRSYGSYSGSGYTNTHKDDHWDSEAKAWVANKKRENGKDYVWVSTYYDKDQGKSIPGHWLQVETTGTGAVGDGAKHREAGTSRYDGDSRGNGSITDDPRWQAYFNDRYGTPKANKPNKWPKGSLNVVSTSEVEEQSDEAQRDDDYYHAILDDLLNDLPLDRDDIEFLIEHDNPEMNPDTIEAMTDRELLEVGGYWTEDEMDRMVPLDRRDEDDDEVIEGEVIDEAHIAAKKARMDLEDEVWAHYEDLTMEDLQNMDVLVLEDLLLRASHTPEHTLLTYHGVLDDGEPTGELKVSEVLGELSPDEQEAWNLSGRTYMARDGKLEDITDELAAEQAAKSPLDSWPKLDPIKVAQAQGQQRQLGMVDVHLPEPTEGVA